MSRRRRWWPTTTGYQRALVDSGWLAAGGNKEQYRRVMFARLAGRDIIAPLNKPRIALHKLRSDFN
jgi:hypothetical protein